MVRTILTFTMPYSKNVSFIFFFMPPFLRFEAEYPENSKIYKKVIANDFVHHNMK